MVGYKERRIRHSPNRILITYYISVELFALASVSGAFPLGKVARSIGRGESVRSAYRMADSRIACRVVQRSREKS